MNLKRVRSLMLCVLPLGLPLFTACIAPIDESAAGTDTDEGSVGAAVQALNSMQGIACGGESSLAVRSDGTVFSSGTNPGDGTTIVRTSPVQVSGLSGITAVAAGKGADDVDDAFALKSNGTVFAWGANDSGQLGDGTTIDRASPVQVIGLSGVTAVATGASSYALALKWDGTVFAWGADTRGQLGDGHGVARHTPAQINGLSDVTAVAAASLHALALKSDGTVFAWGFNGNGELGIGTMGGDCIPPTQVVGLSDVTAVAGGSGISIALKSNGTVFAWGNTRTSSGKVPAPIQVSGLSGIIAVAAGGGSHHALALKADGTVFAWGKNDHGQLGDGTIIARTSPVQVSGLSDVVAVAAGQYHSLARTSDGTVFAFGKNGLGQLGDGTTTKRTTPVPTTFNGDAD